LLLLLALGGCQSVPLLRRQTLHVMLTLSPGLEWLEADYRGGRSWGPLLRSFRRLHPEARVQFSLVAEADLAKELQRSHRRGLGPDLLLVRAPVAIELLQQGLVIPLPHTPELQASLATLESRALHAVETPRGLAGLPVFSEPSLACYDRQRILEPPATTDALLALAAGGQPIGLAVDPVGLWWSVGALGARQALAPLLTGLKVPAQAQDQAADRQAILGWLYWLRQASQQSRVDLAAGPEELTQGLESGRLAWIPCFSIAIPRLERTMGQRLGVATLPAGPGGPPSPFNTLRVWAFGADSSGQQRRLAMDLARFTLDPGVQPSFTLRNQILVPANRYAPIPVASSGRLATLAKTQQQAQQLAPIREPSFTSPRIRRILPRVESVMDQVMEGVLTPDQGTEVLLKLEAEP
jgi:maltose-binding protein MalE